MTAHAVIHLGGEAASGQKPRGRGVFYRLFGGGNPHGSKEAGRLQCVLAGFQGIVFLDVGSGAALLGGELAITDEAVRPVVHGGRSRDSPEE